MTASLIDVAARLEVRRRYPEKPPSASDMPLTKNFQARL